MKHEAMSTFDPEAAKEIATDVVQAIEQANLVIPQTYGAIRLFGAQEYINADIQDATQFNSVVQETIQETSPRLTNVMHSAHAAKDLEPISFEGKTQEELRRRISSLYWVFYNMAKDAAGDALENVYDFAPEDEDVRAFTATHLSLMRKVLFVPELRSAIKDYQQSVSEKRGDNFMYAQLLQEKWHQHYMQVLHESHPDYSDDVYQELSKLFLHLTKGTADTRHNGL